MADRVVLGKFGTGSGEYGLRVSKTGSAVINANGTAADTSNLIFDSLNPVGSLSIYKIFLVEDVPAYSAPSSVTQTTNVGMGGTPGSTVQSFGETLDGIPYSISQRIISSTRQETYRFSETRTILNTTSGSPPAYTASGGPTDTGWYTITTDSQITVYNYETSTIDVRIALFNFFI